MTQHHPQARWYVRKGGRTHGPFPNQLISRYLILGRLDLECEISQDQTNWVPIKSYKALVPDVVLNAHTPEGARALMLARIREDERSAREKADATGQDRRTDEDQAVKLHRQLRDDILNSYRSRSVINMRNGLIVIIVAVIIMAAFFIYTPPEKPGAPDCNVAPAPGIDWSSCPKQGINVSARDLSASRMVSAQMMNADLTRSRLQGSDLSYANLTQAGLQQADLQQARLVGAILVQASMQGANLSGADLSYADLTGARLDNARLDGARFDRAIWVNGETCLEGSVGGCLQTP
jgi:hypothetical protein